MSGPGEVVITGMGLVSSLGLTRRETWQAIVTGGVGIGPLTAVESPLERQLIGGQAPPQSFDGEREVGYLRIAIDAALREAGLDEVVPYRPQRSGIVLGTTLGGMRSGGRFLRTGDHAHLRHFLAGAALRDAIVDLPLQGSTTTTCSACSSGLVSLSIACDLLLAGAQDLMLAGGYDPISEYACAGFGSLRLIADGPPMPFARSRAGMNLGEGYAVLVLERQDAALRRGAAILAHVAGRGETSDAHHLTLPHPEGDGAARAMEAAIRAAGLDASDVDMISAHATATANNDASEHTALARVFGPRLAGVPVVAFKSHLGHTLGGSGAVELVLSVTALREQTVPPTANVDLDDLEFDDIAVSASARSPSRLRTAINVSLGFGGTNAAVVVRAPGDDASRASLASQAAATGAERDPVITGVGCILPDMIDEEAFAAAVSRDHCPDARVSPPLDDAAITHLLDARRVRRMSEYARLLLAATTSALRSAGVDDVASFARDGSALLGSAHGSAAYTMEYYGEIVRSGLKHANPMLFAEGVPNIGSAQLSLMLGLRGASQTIIGSRTAGLDALGLAALRIRGGLVDRVIVGAAEERHDVVDAAYRACGLHASGTPGGAFGGGGFVTGWGSVVLVVESRESATRRAARILGTIAAVGGAHGAHADRDHWTNLAAGVLDDIDCPPAVLSSANATWIDGVELEAIRRRAVERDEPAIVSHVYGHIAETFAVMPLAGIAAVLSAGRLPAAGPKVPSTADGPVRRPGAEPLRAFGVLCCDCAGAIRAVRVLRDPKP